MLNLLSFSAISTEITLAGGVFLLVIFGLLFERMLSNSKVFLSIGVLILISCLYCIYFNSHTDSITAFNGLFFTNKYIVLTKAIIIVSAIFSLLFVMGYSDVSKRYLKFEFVSLMLFAVFGMLIMISSNDFMTLYLGLELQTLCLYSLTCFNRDEIRSSEGALKYFILGGVASAIILYGISFIYGFSGTTNFSLLSNHYHVGSNKVHEIPLGVLVGIVMVIVGFAFKIAAVPFHMWAPDVYQGAPLPVTMFLSTTPKAAAIFLLSKLLINDINFWVDVWQQVIKTIAILSLFVGALGALRQTDIKRLLAYSSINHIGFILIGIASNSKLGLESIVSYVCIYIIMNIGIFTCISMLQKPGNENYNLNIFKGLSDSNPILAFTIALIMLSLAGIPPLAGFLAKFYILNAAIKSELYVLTVAAMISAVISTFYYLKIIKIMYFDKNTQAFKSRYCAENVFLVSFSAALNILLVLFPASITIAIY